MAHLDALHFETNRRPPPRGFRPAAATWEGVAGELSYGMPGSPLRLWPATERESSRTRVHA